MNASTEPFVQALNAYKAAVLAKDVVAFAALYDDDLHVFDMWGAWSMRGIEPWRLMAGEWFSSLGAEQVVVSFRDAQSSRAGDLAVGHAILTYTAVSAEGNQLRSLSSRLTMVLRNHQGSWKIVHEHTSAPIDQSTMKAELAYRDGA